MLGGKPGSHPEVYREVAAHDALGALETGQWQEGPACRRQVYSYRVARRVPLTASGRVRGTLVEVWAHNRTGQLLYHNAWVTDLDVRATNVGQIVGSGRSRWKIKNEQFNVQKNQGYELTHH